MAIQHDPDPTERVLDAREFRFVEEYVCGGPRERANAYRSAVAAGYTHSTAEVYSASWVRPPSDTEFSPNPKPWVWHAIQAKRAEIASRLPVTKERMAEELVKMGFSHLGAFLKMTSGGTPYIDMSEMTHDDLAALSEVTIDEYTEGRGDDAVAVKKVKVKPYDKRAALESLAKLMGWNAPQKLMHGQDPDNPLPGVVPYDLTQLTDDEVRELKRLLAKAAPQRPDVTAQRAIGSDAQHSA